MDLFRVPLVGGEPRRLASNIDFAGLVAGREADRRWRGLHDQGSQLLLIPAEGGGEEQLLLEQDTGVRGLDWSPDGNSLLLVTAARVNSISSTVLEAVEVATGKRRELYRLPAGSVCSAALWDGNAAVLFAWSPSQAGTGGDAPAAPGARRRDAAAALLLHLAAAADRARRPRSSAVRRRRDPPEPVRDRWRDDAREPTSAGD